MAATKNWRSTDLLRVLDEALAASETSSGDIGVGLSGGRDSVVLLHLASRLGLGTRLRALHVHHGLSPHADAWALHCRQLCASLDVALTILPVSVDKNSGLGVEAAARQARYTALAGCGLSLLLLAHHQSDQAETVLFNLLRGGGVGGAAGMPVARVHQGLRLWRPLLGVPANCIADYAKEMKLTWIDDESNLDLRFSRNYLRHEIFPRLTARFPRVLSSLGQAAANFSEAGELLADLAEMDWHRCADQECLKLPEARHLSTARLKNLLRWRLRVLGWQVPVATRLDEFVRQLQFSGPDRHPALVLPGGEMQVKGQRLHWRA